jgi:hypothetical protein
LTIVRVPVDSQQKTKHSKHGSLRVIASSQCDFEPKSEAWYNHHFHVAKHISNDRRAKPYNALANLKPEFVEQQVPQRLRQDPLNFACLDRADDAILSSCLELYIARVKKQTHSFSEARSRYLQDRPGTNALLALSRLGGSDLVVFLDRTRLFRSITHCLVAENEEEAVWQWVADKSRSGPHAAAQHFLDTKEERWKIDLMRPLVDVQLHWAPNADFTSGALATVLKQDDTFRLSDKGSAIVRLVRILFGSSATCKDVRLFNKFRAAARRLFHVYAPKGVYVALLDLVHPELPSADKYLQWLRNDMGAVERTAQIEHHFTKTSLRGLEGLLSELYRAILVCLNTGRREDAIWILDFAYIQRPQLFGTAASMKRYLSGLERVHSNAEPLVTPRRASASEIEAGVLVDESGYRVHSPQMMENIRLTKALRYGAK